MTSTAKDDASCALCGIASNSPLSTVGEKGCQSILSASKEKGEIHNDKIVKYNKLNI